jgi:hypothetical protein
MDALLVQSVHGEPPAQAVLRPLVRLVHDCAAPGARRSHGVPGQWG